MIMISESESNEKIRFKKLKKLLLISESENSLTLDYPLYFNQTIVVNFLMKKLLV
jgi:hypothetical protein